MIPSHEGEFLRVHIQSNPEAPMVFQVTPERLEAALRRHAAVIHRVEVSLGTTPEQLDAALKEVNVLVGWTFPQKGLEQLAPHLKWIHVWGAGIDHLLPLDWLPKGVFLTNNRGVHVPKAREYIQMAILMLHTQIPALVTSQQQRRWDERFSTLVARQTILIVGVGHMGSAAAKAAKQLGMHVLGIRRSNKGHRYVDEMYGPEALPRLLPRVDILLVTTPLTAKTQGLIGRQELDLLRPQAGVINLGRAPVMDYDALADKLEKGELSGAILDVFEPEPLPAESRLWSTPNLILTPHVASDDSERYIPLTLDLLFENIERYFSDRPLRNRVRRRLEY
ncbi:MAG TPA: D-2-hydroxyacid dehydrogenase [Anaerolineae bacterium]|nr:D-2-hydroxyacid dehydrogenase [Anaerolineae bacterium]